MRRLSPGTTTGGFHAHTQAHWRCCDCIRVCNRDCNRHRGRSPWRGWRRSARERCWWGRCGTCRWRRTICACLKSDRASWPGQPAWRGWGRPGWGNNWAGGYWPGYGVGLGAAAVGAGLAYASSNYYCDPNYASNGYCNAGSYAYGSAYGSYAPPTYGANYGSIVPASGGYANGSFASAGIPTYRASYAVTPPDAIAIVECARRFRSYDPESQTYLSNSGQRISCP